MSSVLPTNPTSFFRAYLRFLSWDDERIDDYITINNLGTAPGTYLMLQGGAAGVAQVDSVKDLNDNPLQFKFGEGKALEIVSEVAKVYELDVPSIKDLVP